MSLRSQLGIQVNPELKHEGLSNSNQITKEHRGDDASNECGSCSNQVS